MTDTTLAREIEDLAQAMQRCDEQNGAAPWDYYAACTDAQSRQYCERFREYARAALTALRSTAAGSVDAEEDVKRVTAAMAARREELIAQPLSRIWNELAATAIRALASTKAGTEGMADALRDAINYALSHPHDGLEWLRAWNEGDPEAMSELAQIAAAPPAPAQGEE